MRFELSRASRRIITCHTERPARSWTLLPLLRLLNLRIPLLSLLCRRLRTRRQIVRYSIEEYTVHIVSTMCLLTRTCSSRSFFLALSLSCNKLNLVSCSWWFVVFACLHIISSFLKCARPLAQSALNELCPPLAMNFVCCNVSCSRCNMCQV